MNEEKVNDPFKKLTKVTTLLGSKRMVGRLSAATMAIRILPFVSLVDSGYSRGIFVGAFESAGIRVPHNLIRDRRFVDRNDPQINASKFSEGRRQGRRVMKSGSNIRGIKIKMSRRNFSMFIRIVRGEVDRTRRISLEDLMKAVKR